MKLQGRCHCGNIEVELETSVEPARLPLRACQCAFCRRHGARTTSDAGGRLRVVIADPSATSRYRFGLRLTDFVVCSRCGVYVVAMMADGDRLLATVNVNTMDDPAPFARAAAPMGYGEESAEARVARRRGAWTPTEVVTRAVPRRD